MTAVNNSNRVIAPAMIHRLAIRTPLALRSGSVSRNDGGIAGLSMSSLTACCLYTGGCGT